MKKTLRLVAGISGAVLSTLAATVGTASVNSVCIAFFHQPKVPQGMDKFNAVKQTKF